MSNMMVSTWSNHHIVFYCCITALQWPALTEALFTGQVLLTLHTAWYTTLPWSYSEWLESEKHSLFLVQVIRLYCIQHNGCYRESIIKENKHHTWSSFQNLYHVGCVSNHCKLLTHKPQKCYKDTPWCEQKWCEDVVFHFHLLTYNQIFIAIPLLNSCQWI